MHQTIRIVANVDSFDTHNLISLVHIAGICRWAKKGDVLNKQSNNAHADRGICILPAGALCPAMVRYSMLRSWATGVRACSASVQLSVRIANSGVG